MDRAIDSQPVEWSTRRVIVATILITAVIVVFALILQFNAALFVLFLGIVLGMAVRPGVDWLHRQGLPRFAGVLIIYFALLILVALFALLVAPLILEQSREIVAGLPEYYASLRSMLVRSPSLLIRQLGRRMPTHLEIGGALVPATENGDALGRVGWTIGMFGTVMRGVLMTLAVLLLGYYWNLESRRLTQFGLLLLPAARRGDAEELVGGIESKVGGYVRAQVIISAMMGVMAITVYLILGLPYSVILALMAAVGEVIPILGPTLGTVPAVLVALSISPERAVIVVIAVLFINAVGNYVMVPRVMNHTVGVNPIVTLLALAAFGALFGLPGAVLAIPMAAIVQLLLDRFLLPSDEDTPALVGRGQVGRLRYETQDLAQDVRRQGVRRGQELVVETEPVEDDLEAIARDLDELLASLEGGEEPS